MNDKGLGSRAQRIDISNYLSWDTNGRKSVWKMFSKQRRVSQAEKHAQSAEQTADRLKSELRVQWAPDKLVIINGNKNVKMLLK